MTKLLALFGAHDISNDDNLYMWYFEREPENVLIMFYYVLF